MYLSKSRLHEIFDNMRNLTIAVIGDSMLDEYIFGDVERISPEAPVPVIKFGRKEIRIGGAANVADNLAVLGVKPILISLIGDDEAGDSFIHRCSELELDTSRIIIDNKRHTIVKTRVIARNQQICRIDKEDVEDIDGETYETAVERLRSISNRISAIIISDYGKGFITRRLVGEAIDICCSLNVFVSIDPKEHHLDYYVGADLIKPNIHEVSRATNMKIESTESLEKAGWKFLDITGAKSALITTGERGMSIFEKGKPVKHLPTTAREVFDVTGAGDTVIAVLTASISAGASLEESAIIANHAAGIVVGEVGTAVATPEEIFQSFNRGNF